MIVTSLENEKVKKFKKLQKRKYREEFNEYIIEGDHLIIEAYKKGAIEELILCEGENIPVELPYTYYSKEVMKKISTMDTPSTMMALCKKIEKEKIIGERILMLDGIQDPGNLGTIIRSAVAFNIDTIILTENTVDKYNPKVLRATQGMIYHVNVVEMNGYDAINLLHNQNIPVYGTDVNNGLDASSLTEKEKKKFAVIMGNEGNGVRQEISKMCDKNLYIKMNDKVESLNVGVAASILLYELGR